MVDGWELYGMWCVCDVMCMWCDVMWMVDGWDVNVMWMGDVMWMWCEWWWMGEMWMVDMWCEWWMGEMCMGDVMWMCMWCEWDMCMWCEWDMWCECDVYVMWMGHVMWMWCECEWWCVCDVNGDVYVNVNGGCAWSGGQKKIIFFFSSLFQMLLCYVRSVRKGMCWCPCAPMWCVGSMWCFWWCFLAAEHANSMKEGSTDKVSHMDMIPSA
jgi:hypothetical protein